MNELPYAKYSGCGNLFVLLDNRGGRFSDLEPFQARQLCTLGADGVILLERSTQADLRMRVFNADGSEAEMCGNGIRCLLRFALDLGLPSRSYRVETKERVLGVQPVGHLFRVEMGSLTHIRWGEKVSLEGTTIEIDLLNTGVPHGVLFVPDSAQAKVATVGPLLRHHPHFAPNGINVNFCQVLEPQYVHNRTYERGVEGETLACGTGAVAAALSASRRFHWQPPVRVRLASGEELSVDFQYSGHTFSKVYLTGAAHKVTEGHFPASWLEQGALR